MHRLLPWHDYGSYFYSGVYFKDREYVSEINLILLILSFRCWGLNPGPCVCETCALMLSNFPKPSMLLLLLLLLLVVVVVVVVVPGIKARDILPRNYTLTFLGQGLASPPRPSPQAGDPLGSRIILGEQSWPLVMPPIPLVGGKGISLKKKWSIFMTCRCQN